MMHELKVQTKKKPFLSLHPTVKTVRRGARKRGFFSGTYCTVHCTTIVLEVMGEGGRWVAKWVECPANDAYDNLVLSKSPQANVLSPDWASQPTLASPGGTLTLEGDTSGS